MTPEEIQGREFLVGLRGYDKDEVQRFLADVALEYEALQRQNDELRSGSGMPDPDSSIDEFESLGSSVAAILRAAKESASEITANADRAALQVREDAEQYAALLHQQADQALAAAGEQAETLRHRVANETEEMRRAASVALAEARAEADRILREANERVGALAVEAEERARNEAKAMIDAAKAHTEEARRKERALRTRLQEAADELGLAILALGEQDDADDDGSSEAEGSTAEQHAWS